MIRQLTTAVSIFVAASALGAYPDPDEQILRDAKIKRDDESLVKFLGRLSAEEKDLSQRDELVRQLGTESFAERQKAIERLTAMGAAAVAHLQKATQTGSAEVRKNAQKCLDAIQGLAPPGTPLAAVRLVIKRPSPGAVEALLRYLPSAADYEVQEEISFGLDHLTEKAKTIPPALRTALTDANPARRAIAACILGHRGTDEDKTAVNKCLTDTDATVRLRAAQGLLAAKQKDGIPTLIALLNGTAMDVAWQAEELLRYVAGKSSPKALVGNGEEGQRKACGEAWAGWWTASGAKVDFGDADKEHRRPGLVLCYDCKPGDGERTFWMMGCDSTIRFQRTIPVNGFVLSELPGGAARLRGFVRSRAENKKEDEEQAAFEKLYPQFAAENDGIKIGRRTTSDLRVDSSLIQKPPYAFHPIGNFVAACADRVLEFDDIMRIQWVGYCPRDAAGACRCLQTGRMGFTTPNPDDFDIADTIGYRLRCLLSRKPAVRAYTWDWLFSTLAVHTGLFTNGVSARIFAFFAGNIDKLSRDEIKSMFNTLRALRSSSPASRLDALYRMPNFNHEARLFVPLLLERLKDPDPKVRAYAGIVACFLPREYKRVVPALIAALKDPEIEVRGNAMYSLGQFGNNAKAALPEMMRLLLEDRSGSLGRGYAAIGELAREEDPTTIQQLIQAAKRKETRYVAVTALAAAGKGAREAVPVFVELLEKGAPELPRDQYASLFIGIAEVFRELGPDANAAIPALIGVLSDRTADEASRRRAMDTLAHMGEPAKVAIPAIMAACKADPDLMRRGGAEALRILEAE